MTIRIEIFSSQGCTRCARARTLLRDMVEAMRDDRLEWHTIEVLDEIDYAVSLGVLATPAIAIDGELIFASLPNEKRLQAELNRRLSDLPHGDAVAANSVRHQE